MHVSIIPVLRHSVGLSGKVRKLQLIQSRPEYPLRKRGCHKHMKTFCHCQCCLLTEFQSSSYLTLSWMRLNMLKGNPNLSEEDCYFTTSGSQESRNNLQQRQNLPGGSLFLVQPGFQELRTTTSPFCPNHTFNFFDVVFLHIHASSESCFL